VQVELNPEKQLENESKFILKLNAPNASLEKKVLNFKGSRSTINEPNFIP